MKIYDSKKDQAKIDEYRFNQLLDKYDSCRETAIQMLLVQNDGILPYGVVMPSGSIDEAKIVNLHATKKELKAACIDDVAVGAVMSEQAGN